MPNTRRWILLRGLARGTGHWGSFAEQIQKHFPQDEFEFLDLPGNGERYAEESPLSIPEYVKDLRERSEFVKKGYSFNILSISLGAMVTVEWMREYPHEVKKAFLICTSSSNFSPFYHRYGLHNYLPSLKLSLVKDASKWEQGILNMVTNNHERRQAEFAAMSAYSNENPIQVKNVLRQLVAAARYHFPEQAPGDVVILGSYGDRLVSPTCSLKIAEHWGLHPNMHSWAGHDIPVDDPQWVLEHLL